MSKFSITNENYWANYNGLQNAKHSILSRYLDSWYPIISRWNGRVIYIDCHSGRGRHKTGHKDSPLIAIERLVNHKFLSNILRSEIRFFLFERDAKNYEELIKEISTLGKLPKKIKIFPCCENYENELIRVCDTLEEHNQCLASSHFCFH